LLVAEAPPCATDRFFYFDELAPKGDWLFRYVWEGLTGRKPEKAKKPANLAALRDAGVYLIDLHEDNISKPSNADLKPRVPGLIDRCRSLRPQRIVLIKASVYDVAFEPMRAAGLPVVDARLPFPASSQQLKFLEGFRRILSEQRLVLSIGA